MSNLQDHFQVGSHFSQQTALLDSNFPIAFGVTGKAEYWVEHSTHVKRDRLIARYSFDNETWREARARCSHDIILLTVDKSNDRVIPIFWDFQFKLAEEIVEFGMQWVFHDIHKERILEELVKRKYFDGVEFIAGNHPTPPIKERATKKSNEWTLKRRRQLWSKIDVFLMRGYADPEEYCLSHLTRMKNDAVEQIYIDNFVKTCQPYIAWFKNLHDVVWMEENCKDESFMVRYRALMLV